jgi:uncharacterized tellurite resistance protein B-like protein
MTIRDDAQAKLAHILSVLKTPAGFSKLNPNQKKFLFGVVLSSVVPSDRVVKPCEQEALHAHLKNFLHLHGDAESEAFSLSSLPPMSLEHVDGLARALSELLGVQDRSMLVRHLWELALSDEELHSEEEKLIYRIADVAGVPRKQVAEQLAWVSAQS